MISIWDKWLKIKRLRKGGKSIHIKDFESLMKVERKHDGTVIFNILHSEQLTKESAEDFRH
jgi:hypothetical protein